MDEHSAPHAGELAASVVALALAQGAGLATAESCTGGLVAHLLTAIAGVSATYRGGIVAYANEAKRDVLGVDETLLRSYGAVSEPVALGMAAGACALFGATHAVSTTGIAGPGGGTATKPVGLVYIAVQSPGAARCREFRFSGTRAEITLQAASEALGLLLEVLSTSTR